MWQQTLRVFHANSKENEVIKLLTSYINYSPCQVFKAFERVTNYGIVPEDIKVINQEQTSGQTFLYKIGSGFHL